MSEQEQFEAWWNGDRPTDFTEYGASQWTKAHAYSAWLARASRPREAAGAPEACPVAEKPLAWTAFSESASWTGVWCKTREGAQERVDEFKRRWPKTGPYRVVPLYAQPASAAGREGVARFIEECDERHNHRCACYAMSMENRRCDEAKSIAAIRALLAAEAAGGDR